MSYTSDLLRWLQRKRYQYEVTFSLYMLTPTEKFIFNSFLFLFLSMIIIAASLYLPEHIMTMISRAWFYYAGDETATTRKTSGSDTPQFIKPGYGAREGKLASTRLPGQNIMDMLGAL